MLEEFFKNAWRWKCGVQEKHTGRMPDFEELRKTQWCEEFEQYQRNRLVMGAFRYGLLEHQDFTKYDLCNEVCQRIARYLKTNNLEHLVDAGNICMLAYIKGKREGKIFSAHDDTPHTPEKA